VFENGQTLQHLAFFEEVAAREEHEPEWRAATAGLVTLRLVDQWIEEGPNVVAAEGWGVRAVLNAIDQMDDGSPTPAILRSIVAAMEASRVTDVLGVVPRLLAYGQALEYDAKWALAADVYETVIAHTHPVEHSDSATAAHLRRGVCLRTLGHFAEASEAFAAASAVASEADDMVGVLRARIGEAKIAVARGNLPGAEVVLDETIARASELGMSVIRSEALHDRAMVAGLRGRYDLAVELAYEALRGSVSPDSKDRILNDIGTAFYLLGLRSVARDAFLVLSATAQHQYMRWLASLSLMEIAAEDGSEPIFEQYRSRLKASALPPELETEYYIRLGRGYRRLDHEDLGQIALAKAVQLAEHYGFATLLFEAEAATKAMVRRSSTDRELSPQISDIAHEVRHMRAAALAGD
jgi:tetratricopeptide (TPR) repeat protein